MLGYEYLQDRYSAVFVLLPPACEDRREDLLGGLFHDGCSTSWHVVQIIVIIDSKYIKTTHESL